MNRRALTFITFFSSTSTLLCCALPALFVTLGLGSTFASLMSTVPQLVWLSENKTYLFIVSGVLLSLGGYMQWQARNAPCPIDPQLRQMCITSRKWGLVFYLVSLGIFLIGFSFSYLLG